MIYDWLFYIYLKNINKLVKDFHNVQVLYEHGFVERSLKVIQVISSCSIKTLLKQNVFFRKSNRLNRQVDGLR